MNSHVRHDNLKMGGCNNTLLRVYAPLHEPQAPQAQLGNEDLYGNPDKRPEKIILRKILNYKA